ncbi:unnamed protein product [Anisakis simplex]|uniref:VWFA domain-containing protein n=1 Tax=Anisakis simplex TaxID=6269 RepID=A0A0M3KFL5_ANISI|nr:unnamed protein product [Anisakis simplex]
MVAGECKKTPVDVLFLVDITTDNNKVFEAQQKKIVETIRHLSGSGFVSDARFGIIVFNQRPLLLVPLTSPRAKVLERMITEVAKIKARRNLETSPARAFDLAATHLNAHKRDDAKRLVMLVHNGHSTDLIAETMESR